MDILVALFHKIHNMGEYQIPFCLLDYP
jgi:hypothetical protein